MNAMQRLQEAFCLQLEGLGRGIPRPEMLFSDAQQSLDIEGDRLKRAVESRQQRLGDRIEVLGNKITHPSDFIVLSDEKLARFSEHLILSSRSVLGSNSQRLSSLEPEQRLLSALDRLFDVASQKNHWLWKIIGELFLQECPWKRICFGQGCQRNTHKSVEELAP